MYIKQNQHVYIRKIGEIIYIQDRFHFTDMMLAGSSSEFLKRLDTKPNTLEYLFGNLDESFINVSKDTIKKDFVEFYEMLNKSGFVSFGETIEECMLNDNASYKDFIEEKNDNEDKKEYILSKKATGDEMQKYLNEHPTIMSFQVEISSTCNERCVHCYISHECKTEIMSFEMFKKTLNDLKEIGTIVLSISGGEPMTNPNFLEFIKLADKMGFAVVVLSNLTLMNNEILEQLKNMRDVSVQTSLYSMDPSIHDAITQLEGSFELTKKWIEILVKNNIKVQVSCPAMKENKKSFPAVINWCEKEMRIRAYSDFALIGESNCSSHNLCHQLSIEETKEFIKEMIDADESYQEMLKEKDLLIPITRRLNENDTVCGMGISSAAMNVYGDVIPCSGFDRLSCGNVMEQSISDIWYNSTMMKKIRNLKMKDFPKCMSCDSSAYCSICLKRHESVTNDIYKLAPYYCELARANKEVAEKWRQEQAKQKEKA